MREERYFDGLSENEILAKLVLARQSLIGRIDDLANHIVDSHEGVVTNACGSCENLQFDIREGRGLISDLELARIRVLRGNGRVQ